MDLEQAPGVVSLQQRRRDAVRLPAVADDVDCLEGSLPAGPAAPATARAALTRWLTGVVPLEVLENARLLVSELVANSVGHADLPPGSSLGIAMQLTRGALRVEVRDPGSPGVIAPRQADRVDGGGFGLHLVELLSTRWGVNRAGGTRVWFELDATGATD